MPDIELGYVWARCPLRVKRGVDVDHVVDRRTELRSGLVQEGTAIGVAYGYHPLVQELGILRSLRQAAGMTAIEEPNVDQIEEPSAEHDAGDTHGGKVGLKAGYGALPIVGHVETVNEEAYGRAEGGH